MIAFAPPSGPLNLVLMDVGNSSVKAATWLDGKRGDARTVATSSADDVTSLLGTLWNALPENTGRAVAICSVCPPLLAELHSYAKDHSIDPLLVVGEDIPAPIAADVNEPGKVGTDRLCAAAAAYDLFKAACVVADFGTALTIDLVADNGVFLGGTILPGLKLSALALHEHTAMLPLVEIGQPSGTLGKDTSQAIRFGIVAMMCGALREITERYATEIGKWPPLVVSGGDARSIAATCDFIDRVAPDLCLDGIVLAVRLAMDASRREHNP
jgi:type III pantothenate kinase